MIHLKFNGAWRDYQKEVLDNLEKHLTDKKLHIVAAPGAGKTTLGIEVIGRLKKNVLIFAPTLTIRNQWKERILSSFMDKKESNLISLDIKNPKPITITTYQSLWAAFSGHNAVDDAVYNDEEKTTSEPQPKDNSSQIIRKLQTAHFGVFCFDEAHHLKKEWWNALQQSIEKIKPEQIISLTATPPYDVSQNEWNRYESLCGPIDEFISIPTLVKNGDLCPHQDYIYFSALRTNENQKIVELENNVNSFMTFLMEYTPFQEKLLTQDIFVTPNKYIELIFDNPDFFISMASYLNAAGRQVPKAYLNLFDMSIKEIPPFNIQLAEVFLNGLLGKVYSFFKPLNDQIKSIEKELRGKGIVHRGKVCLCNNPLLRKEMALSAGKLDSIIQIVKSEENVLKDTLRLVVLADYIRKDEKDETANSLGVVPIFLKINSAFPHLSLAILTGSLVVIPKNTKQCVLDKVKEEGLTASDIKLTPFKQNTDFFQVNFSAASQNKLVKIMTSLFTDGVFKILVGTQALLGEGWDAPCINSLILSSTISSYVSSNQMRGRAIRKDKHNPNKVANIWHLVSFKHFHLWNAGIYQAENLNTSCFDNEMFDMEQIKHRFEGYEAPTIYTPYVIQSGLDRLNLGVITENKISQLNAQTILLSQNREKVRQSWNEALFLGDFSKRRMHTGFKTNQRQKSFVFKGSFGFLMSFYTGISFELYSILHRIYAAYALPITAIFSLYFMGRSSIKFIRNGSVVGSMKSIITTTLNTLIYMGKIRTPFAQCAIIVKKDIKGQIFCSVSGLPSKEANLLLQAVQEILNPIDNPRYLIVRKSFFLNFLAQKDYHAVPALIGTNKKYVAYFMKEWKKNIGSAQMIYTRSILGRRLLLKTRKFAFSDAFKTKTSVMNEWS